MTYKIFLDNPYLKEIDAKVLKKEVKNNSSYIQLDKTIFYPNLVGGQPMDYGTINNMEVLDVIKLGEDIIHVVRGDLKETRVSLSIDWDRRFDLMQQHTGQHILSSSFHRLYNATTLAIHIGEEYSTIDIKKPSLTEDEASQVEYLANKVTQSNFKVKSYYVPKDQLPRLPLRRDTSIEDDDIRIIEVDNIDYAACCGTHVSNTGEVGLIKILNWESYKGNTRVTFVSGSRALEDYSWKNTYIKSISRLLSSKDKDLLNKVNNLYNNKEILEKENRKLREDLLNIKGQLLLKERVQERDVDYLIKKFHNADIKELHIIAANLNKSQEKLIQIYGIFSNEIGQFIICRSKDLNINLKEIYYKISNQIIIKGGGSPQMVQGTAALSTMDKVVDLFEKEIKAIL